MAVTRWRIGLSLAAQRDFTDIIDWTVDRFGAGQAVRYAESIKAALDKLATGPDAIGSRVGARLPTGLRILPISRRGVRARHLLIFRVVGPTEIEIVRILHEAMDIARHVEEE